MSPENTPSTPVVYRQPTRRIGRFWRLWFVLSLLFVVACVAAAVSGLTALDHLGGEPLHVIVNGEEVYNGFDLSALTVGHQVVAVCVLAAVALVLMLLVPFIVMLVAGSVLLALVCGLGVPALVVGAVFALLSSPFWLAGGLIWLIVRNRRAASATIRA